MPYEETMQRAGALIQGGSENIYGGMKGIGSAATALGGVSGLLGGGANKVGGGFNAGDIGGKLGQKQPTISSILENARKPSVKDNWLKGKTSTEQTMSDVTGIPVGNKSPGSAYGMRGRLNNVSRGTLESPEPKEGLDSPMPTTPASSGGTKAMNILRKGSPSERKSAKDYEDFLEGRDRRYFESRGIPVHKRYSR